MTPELRIDANIDALLRASGSGIERIDANLDAVLIAAGSGLRYYTVPSSIKNMREAMRRIMSDSYIKGSQDNFDALVESGRLKK